MEQIDPKDLFYQILDGLRTLTHYDHSSALLIRQEGDPALRLVAEQIAWTKAKSQRIGLRLPISEDAARMLHSEQVYGFDRHEDGWQEWKGQPAATLADLLDYNTGDAGDGEIQREASMLCAPLFTRDGLVGVLKIAARYPGQLTSYDAELVEHFRSQAGVAIQNLHRTESLRARVVTAERKHAMAELARTVSHDVNNALGSMLPLVQQMQEDLQGGTLEPFVFKEDLEQVQKSLQVCRRIFGGMLSFSRGAARRDRHGEVRRAIDTASAILKYGMGRGGITFVAETPDDLPAVVCGQSDLEQVLLNLLTNAREATLSGGNIRVGARFSESLVEISIADTGCGIPPQDLLEGRGTVLHDQAARQRPRPFHLPFDSLGGRWQPHDSERAWTRHSGRYRRAPGASTTAGVVVMKRARILVVDDEPGMIRAVERVLGEAYQVVGSRSSRHAVSIAAEFKPDLAILDIRMPELDGFELMARLKAGSSELDIILMTGSIDDMDDKLIRAIRSPAFYFIQKPFDRDVLRTLVERCLELRWIREQNRQHLDRLETEIAEARAFQQSLLPDREMIVNRLAIACRYTPCSGLGGDLYDYAAGNSGQTALLIADVSGHGVSAAMLTGVVKSAFHASRVDGYEPQAVVHRVWAGIAAFSAERFVTLFAALAAPDEGRLRFVNAGHPPCILWGEARDPVWLASTGPLVSPALPQARWAVEVVPLGASDQLLLYTDGVSELLADADGCADAQLQTAIERRAQGGAELLDSILAEVHQHLAGCPQPDDLTLLTASVL